MRNKMSKILLAIVLFVMIAFPIHILASGSFSASLAKSSIVEGSSTKLTIKTSNAAGKFTVSSANTSIATVTASQTWVDGNMDTTINVKGVSAGSTTIIITPVDVSDDEYNLLTTPKRLNIKVTAKSSNNPQPAKSKSSNNLLESLTSDVVTIDFNSKTYKYNVIVDKDVNTLNLVAKTQDSKASYSIDGDKDLQVGENTITITVTAENGSKQVYEVIVNKSAYGFGLLKDLRIKDYLIYPDFDPEILNYSLIVSDVTSLEVEYELFDEKAEVTITGNENLVVGDNTITVKVVGSNGKETIYTIKVNNKESVVNRNNILWIVIISILGILLIIETIYIVKSKKRD